VHIRLIIVCHTHRASTHLWARRISDVYQLSSGYTVDYRCSSCCCCCSCYANWLTVCRNAEM